MNVVDAHTAAPDLAAAFASGDRYRAAAAWRDAPPSARTDPALLRTLSLACESWRALDLLDDVLTAAVAANPEDLWFAARHVQNAAARGDIAAALTRSEQVAGRFPDVARSNVLRGEILAEAGRFDEAARYYRAAIRLETSFPWGHIRYAELAARQGDEAARLHRLQAGYLAAPSDPRIVRELAAALHAAGRTDEARTILNDGSHANPDDTTLKPALADLERARPATRPIAQPVTRPVTQPVTQPAGKSFGPSIKATRISAGPSIFLSGATDIGAVVEPVMSFGDNGEQPAYFLFTALGNMLRDGPARANLAGVLRELRKRFPRANLRVLAQEPNELKLARDAGFEADLVNDGIFLDEEIHAVIPGVTKRYDAVYAASPQPRMRHDLAVAVRGLSLLVGTPQTEEVAALASRLPAATITAGTPGTREQARLINEARCGLCLASPDDAADFGMEYLLCGLPVVATQSIAGRDWLFPNRCVVTCASDPVAVREAVAEIARRELPADYVRAAALARVERERLAFFALLDRIFAENAQPARRAAAEFRAYRKDRPDRRERLLSQLLDAPPG